MSLRLRPHLLAAPVGLGLLAGAGCISQGTHDAALQRSARQLAESQKQLQLAEVRVADAEKRAMLLERVSRRLEQRLRVARLELEVHRSRATEAARLTIRLAEQVSGIPRAALLGLAVIEHRQRATIRIPEAALFRPGARQLTADGARLLAALAVILREVGGDAFGASAPAYEVGGHTDEPPAARGTTRWDLSLARAVAVAGALEKGGVPGFRLHPTGYAGLAPLDASRTPEARLKNRRIEIVLVPQRAVGAGLFRPPPSSTPPAAR
jgi:chemotaxis protein MotB